MGTPILAGGTTDLDHQPAVTYFRKEALATFDDQAHCLGISANGSTVLNQRRASLLGKSFCRPLSERDCRKFTTFLEQASPQRTLRLQRKEEWLEISYIRATDDGHVLLIQNITEHVRQANALRKASLEAELALRGQSEFFAHISHELRTPLNAIMGFSEIMHQELFGELHNPRYRDYMDILHQSSQDLLKKINDLLEISSLTAGIDEMNEVNLPLEELVRGAINVHARDLFRRHIRVDVSLSRCTLICDRLKLQQAITHLLHNAIKFAPPESVITVDAQCAANGSLTLSIADEGNGFTDQQLETLDKCKEHFSFMERNRRLLGFGLPLAQELALLHGGSLRCRNLPTGGAEVTITLPRERVIGVQQLHPTTVAMPLEACA